MPGVVKVAEMQHARPASVEAETELGEIQRLLGTAWDERLFRLRRPMFGSPSPAGLRVGEWIRRLCFFRFGVAFEGDLALLLFKCMLQGPRELTLRLEWHARYLNPDWRVFVHFLGEEGKIRFQADHPFGRRLRDELGFLYYDWPVLVAADVPPGDYAIRMGVWWPSERRHLQVYGFRGVRQEGPGWCENAVYVGNCRIGSGREEGS